MPTPRELRRFIRDCVEAAERGDDSTLDIRKHFYRRMARKGLFWGDVMNVLLDPDRFRIAGQDEDGRIICWLDGVVSRVGRVRVVCSVDWDTRLVTLYWD